MKRSANMEKLTYVDAKQRAQLVERNPQPNGVKLLSPSRVSMHDEQDIITLATQIQTADKQIKNTTCRKLCVILDQIKMLQAQAIEIIKESEESNVLHTAACNFVKKPGHIYHLYQKSSGQSYFSMLSPKEWNYLVEQKYLGSYRLEGDYTWTPIEKIEQEDAKMRWAEKLVTTGLNLNDTQMAIDLNTADKII